MVPALIAALGVAQSIGGMVTRREGKKGIQETEQGFYANPYKESAGITDYYNRQLAAANVSPLEGVEGRVGQQQMERNLLTALRMGGAGGKRNVEGLLRSSQDATTGLISKLAAQKRAERGMLGQAAQMKMQEEMKRYKYNVLDPLNRRYNREALKMAEGGSMIGSGIRSAVSGLSAMGSSSGGGSGGGGTGGGGTGGR